MTPNTQRVGVATAIMAIFATANVDFTERKDDAAKLLTSDMRKEVYEHVFQSFKSGETAYAKDFEEKAIRKYIPGLVSNWLRKDENLNGGIKYETKNPGSRAGQGNPEIKELRKLLTQVKGTEHETKVQTALDAKVAAHKASKAKKTEIDKSLIPEDLRDLIS